MQPIVLIITLMTILFLIGAITPMVVAWMRRNCGYIDTSNGTSKSFQNEPVTLLTSVESITARWYRMIIDAENNVVLTTFRWRIDVNNLHCTVLSIGAALADRARLGKPNIDFTIVINRVRALERVSVVKEHLAKTLQLWQSQGALQTQLERIRFFTWSHSHLNNFHSKMLIVDRSIGTLHSCNIEPRKWFECGLILTESQAQFTLQHFERLKRSSSELFVTMDTATEIEFLPYDNSQLHEDLTGMANVSIHYVDNPGSMLSFRRHAYVGTVLKMLDHSYTVSMVSPNFNDYAIFNSLFKARSSVRVLVGSGFNNDVQLLQKYVTGYRSNSQFYQDIVKKHSTDRLQIKCFGDNNRNVVVGKSDFAVHGKVIIIDDRFVVVGSANQDVYSTICSLEIVAIIDSPELANEFSNTFFEPRWAAGVPAEEIFSR
jgi:phosphatidylserine/phosphatidylglycerophosphate/cardiolipin synthase-like enzyme